MNSHSINAIATCSARPGFAHLYRKLNLYFPKNFKIDIKKMLRDKIVSKIKSVFHDHD